MRPGLSHTPTISPSRPSVNRRNDERIQRDQPRIFPVAFEHEDTTGDAKSQVPSSHSPKEGQHAFIFRTGRGTEIVGAADGIDDGADSDGGIEGGDKVAAGCLERFDVHVEVATLCRIVNAV